MTSTDNTPPIADDETRDDWRRHLEQIGEEHGFFAQIGDDHTALYVQEGDTLVVSFDEAERVVEDRPGGMPIGFSAVQARQMSLLSIMASGTTWFRDPQIFAFFDGLREQAFFQSFSTVVFLGVGPMCGHAACVFSSAAPGATVIAVRPVATLAPEKAGFDQRFRADRRLDFSTAYGDAATLIQEAALAVILHDPYDPVDAAHAAQFDGTSVLRPAIRFRGAQIDKMLSDNRVMLPLLRSIEAGTLTPQRIFAVLRQARRQHADSLLHLALRAARNGQARRAGVLSKAAKAAAADSPEHRGRAAAE